MRCSPGEVHVWRIDLDCATNSIAVLNATLSTDERRRAARFASRKLSERWTVARGALRWILAAYSCSNPSSLIFRTEPSGKPELAWPVEHPSFNLSHTGGLALLAIAGSGRVGIDAESVQSNIEIEILSRRFFAPAESEEILRLAPDAQIDAFFACWTRKEAFLKASGLGLSVPLDRFRVTVRADDPPRLVSVDWDQPERWNLVDVGEPGVAAALAVEGCTPAIRRLQFVPPSSV